MSDDKKQFYINWPKGAKLTMDERSLEEIRKSLEAQFKQMIYKQPGFQFFHSIGNTNFFQRFKTHEGIDFGVLHVYWEGDWKHRWIKHEDGYPVVAPFGNSIISEEGMHKIYRIHAEKAAIAAQRQNEHRVVQESRLRKLKQQEDIEEEIENKKILLN